MPIINRSLNRWPVRLESTFGYVLSSRSKCSSWKKDDCKGKEEEEGGERGRLLRVDVLAVALPVAKEYDFISAL